MKRGSFAVLGLCGSLALVSSACGGAQSEASSAESASSTGQGDGSAQASTEPAGPDCSDGTCFSCGEGICPAGAYCEENAPGGAACAWLTECAGESGCDCFSQVLGESCSCSASKGGPSVSCP